MAGRSRQNGERRREEATPMTTEAAPPAAEKTPDGLAARLSQASLGMFDVMSVYVGDRLGLYRTLGDLNRPWLVNSFGSELLPAIPDVHERLTADRPARVADVACGVGWAGIA